MFQSVAKTVRDLMPPQPGVISGAGLGGERIKADDSLSLSFSSLVPRVFSVDFGIALPVMEPLTGYRFKGSRAGEAVGGFLSSEQYYKVVAELKEQEATYGRVVSLPAELGGPEDSFAMPLPDLDTVSDL